VLSWATESLIVDGRGMSDLKQGVTLEIFGEGDSGGPLTEKMKLEWLKKARDNKFDITWTTLGEYLDALVGLGISPNVASFVGATTVRVNVLGEDDRDPTHEELVACSSWYATPCTRRPRCRQLVDLCAGVLCRDAGACRAGAAPRPSRGGGYIPTSAMKATVSSRHSTN
jgi:hypothetical protein